MEVEVAVEEKVELEFEGIVWIGVVFLVDKIREITLFCSTVLSFS